MKKSNWLAVAAAAFLAGAPIIEAEAKRLGSGSNMGRVAPGSSAKQAVPAKPAQPQAAPQAAKPATANPAAAQAATRSSWMGPIAGLAAGLGLAALASMASPQWLKPATATTNSVQRHGPRMSPGLPNWVAALVAVWVVVRVVVVTQVQLALAGLLR